MADPRKMLEDVAQSATVAYMHDEKNFGDEQYIAYRKGFIDGMQKMSELLKVMIKGTDNETTN